MYDKISCALKKQTMYEYARSILPALNDFYLLLWFDADRSYPYHSELLYKCTRFRCSVFCNYTFISQWILWDMSNHALQACSVQDYCLNLRWISAKGFLMKILFCVSDYKQGDTQFEKEGVSQNGLAIRVRSNEFVELNVSTLSDTGPSCEKVTCLNGGVCVEPSVMCICGRDFTGELCETGMRC